MPGLLTNLKILGLQEPSGLSFAIPLLFECMFNPDTYTIEHNILFNTEQPVNSPGTDPGFNGAENGRFSIEFTLDGTGVSSDLEIPVAIPVPVQVLLFNAVTRDISGDLHRPNYLIVQWGTFIRDCVLVNSRITYTLFDSNGIPLRAKVNATFLERTDSKLNQIAGMFSSPDLTHSKLVQEGDILPLMVYKEYKTQDYYLQVAAANKLKNFRKLNSGTTINLPPIS
jgi:Contractile injection system tube protein